MHIDLPDFIETERMILRRPSASDRDAIASAIFESLPELARWFEWAEIIQRYGGVEDLADRATAAADRFDEGLDPTWYGWSRAEPNRMIGEFMLKTGDWDLGILEYMVWIRSDAAGKGFASEASRHIFDVCFDQLGAKLLEARCAPTNGPSRKLMQKLGFQAWGYHADVPRYVLFPASWARHGSAATVRLVRQRFLSRTVA